MIAAVDWESLTVAAAFIVGAVVGAAAAIRIFRCAIDYLKRRDD